MAMLCIQLLLVAVSFVVVIGHTNVLPFPRPATERPSDLSFAMLARGKWHPDTGKRGKIGTYHVRRWEVGGGR